MRLTLKMDRGVLVLLFPKKESRSFYLFPPSNAHLSFKTAKKHQIYELQLSDTACKNSKHFNWSEYHI
jgi:hypothetical protein